MPIIDLQSMSRPSRAFASDLGRSAQVAFGLWLLTLIGSSFLAGQLLFRINWSVCIWFFVSIVAHFEDVLH